MGIDIYNLKVISSEMGVEVAKCVNASRRLNYITESKPLLRRQVTSHSDGWEEENVLIPRWEMKGKSRELTGRTSCAESKPRGGAADDLWNGLPLLPGCCYFGENPAIWPIEGDPREINALL